MVLTDPTPMNFECDARKWDGLYEKDTVATMKAIFQGCSPYVSFAAKSHDYGVKWTS